MSKPLFLSSDGIPTNAPDDSEKMYFSYDPMGTWVSIHDQGLYNIENECVQLHDVFVVMIFGSMQFYYDFLRICPPFIYEAGLNSESRYSKDNFSCLFSKHQSENINKALYLYDCRKLISSIQECSKEVNQLQGEFYRALNFDELFYLPPSDKEEDGIRWMTSPVVTTLYAILSFIFIRLHSLLDYTTKLSLEIEKIRTDFSAYPNLASKNIKFGNRNKISINGASGTVFEKCLLINEIESVRNHVIHDGLLDDMPKAYKVIENGIVVEKFILFPDMNEHGHFEAVKNRHLFYSHDDKINLRLPKIISEFQQRQIATLQLLQKNIKIN